METIHRIANKTLSWVQVGSSKRGFELRGDGNVFGSLKWQKRFGSLAEAVTADGEWTFKRSGFLHPHVTARNANSDQDIAVFKPGWTGTGTLELTTGLKLAWVNKNFLHSAWAFIDQNKEDVLRFQSRPGLMKLNVQVEIPKDLPEVPLLACLGMYLLFMMQEENAAATAAMVPIIAST